MILLTAAVIVVGALCLTSLFLVFGVIRRLREHTGILEGLVRRGGPGGPHAGLPRLADSPVVLGDAPALDRPVGDFTARTVDGEPVSADLLAAEAVVVFLAADCASCRTHLPDVVRWAGDQDRRHTLVVIDGQVADPADMVAVLTPVTRVVVESSGTPVTKAFGATAFPSYCQVRDGVVVASSLDLSRLPAALART